MAMDAMKDALMNRRGKGLDITILLGGQPVMEGKGQMSQDSDLAPPPDGQDGMKEGSPKEESMESPQEESQEDSQDDDSMDEAMTSGMSDYDKQNLMSKKPQSLGERARMDAMNRMKMKK